MRPGELAASAAVIGFDEVEMLGYRDSGMPDTEPNQHPDSFHQADIDEATGRLVAIIRRTRPQVIITYGDDQRATRTPITCASTTSRCWRSNGPAIPTGTRELGEPFQPSKLYYSVWSKQRMRRRARGDARPHRRVAVRARSGSTGPIQDHRITTKVDVGDYLWARDRVVAGARHPGRPDRGVVVRRSTTTSMAGIYPWEDWILARSVVGPIPGVDEEATCSPACASGE